MLQPVSQKSSNLNKQTKRFPLFDLRFPVIFNLAQQDFPVESRALSSSELRIICAAADIPQLVPRTAHHRPDEKIIHTAQLQLAPKLNLTARLQVLHCRRYSQQGFFVALRFVEMNSSQEQCLADFLTQATQNNAPIASILG